MNYPKKMYFGTLKNRKMKTVQNAETEHQLRSQGWVDFAQLSKGSTDDGSQSTVASSSECDTLRQQYEQLQNEHKAIQEQFTELKEKWNNLDAINQQLNELNRGLPSYGAQAD